MAHEVYVFGDSHWRVGFPFTNHGSPGVRHEEDGIETVDTTANELSGATMWGLHKEVTTHMARQRILRTIDGVEGVDNALLIFGEVDVRYHWNRYFKDGILYVPAILELLTKYRAFIEDELIRTGRVRNKVFVYYGYRYLPLAPAQADRRRQPEGPEVLALHRIIGWMIHTAMAASGGRIVTIAPTPEQLEGPGGEMKERYIDPADGIHLLPEPVYHDFVLPAMKRALGIPLGKELPL